MSESLAGSPPPPDPPAPPKKSHKKKPTLREVVESPPPRPTLDAVLDHFFALAGGPAKVANMMLREFDAAAAGSQVRQRILEALLRGLKASDAKGNPADDAGVLSDQDLERQIAVREQRIVEHTERANATPAAGPGHPGPQPAAVRPPAEAGAGPAVNGGSDAPQPGPAAAPGAGQP